MSFPSGGPGYPQQGGGAQHNSPAPGTGGFPQQQHSPLSGTNITMLLGLGVTLLGLVNYFISFSDEASPADGAVTYLLIGGLLAALQVLPRVPRVLPFAALASVFGALEAIVAVARIPSGAGSGAVTVILILGILQMLLAVATLLLDQGVIKLPTHQPQPYAQPYGQFGQPPQGPGEQKGGQGATQFVPKAPPQPQSTVYAPQQGQFYQPPQQHPDTGPQQQQQQQQSPGSGSGGTPQS
jgi:hypothetical protein